MSIDSLLKLFSSDFKEALYKVPFKEGSIETQLLTEAPKCSLRNLTYLNVNLTVDSTVYLESLKLLVAKKDSERLALMSHLINAHKILKDKKPAHRKTFDSALVDIICTCSSYISEIKELDDIKLAIDYIKDQGIGMSDIQEALFGPFTSLIFEEIEVISVQEIYNNELMQQIIKLFTNIKKGVEFGLDTQLLKDQAASLTIEFIEKEILFEEMIKEGSTVPLVSPDMSKILLSEIHRIYPISHEYLQKLNNFSTLITRKDASNLPISRPFTSPNELSYSVEPQNLIGFSNNDLYQESSNNIDSFALPNEGQDEFPELIDVGLIYSSSFGNFKVELKKVKILPNNDLATLKQYSPSNSEWNPDHFANEIRILETLSAKSESQNCILKYISSRLSHNNISILMEYCDTDLQKLIDKRKAEKSPFKEPELLSLIGPILKGFVLIHQAMIFHRDIKPSNILIKYVNGNMIPKICDFGCSEMFTDDEFSQITERVVGSKDFWPPEFFDSYQIPISKSSRAFNHLTSKADIFSLGMTFLYLCDFTTNTGYNLPSHYDQLKKRIEKVEILWIKNLIQKMLCKEPGNREEFRYLLGQLPAADTVPI